MVTTRQYRLLCVLLYPTVHRKGVLKDSAYKAFSHFKMKMMILLYVDHEIEIYIGRS